MATLYRELKLGTVTQMKSDFTFCEKYFADSEQDKYEKNPTDCHRKFLLLKFFSTNFYYQLPTTN